MRLVDLTAWNAAKHINDAELSVKRMASGDCPTSRYCDRARHPVQLGKCFRSGQRHSLGSCHWPDIGTSGAVVQLVLRISPIWIFWVDSVHQLLGHAVVGAILAGWR